jgi:hypothetical protein
VVRDATVSFPAEEMPAALGVNLPNYVPAIVNTSEVVQAISFLKASSRDTLMPTAP